VKTTRIQRHVVEKADAMIAQMVHTTRNRIRRVTAGIAVTAALAGLGGLLAADNGPVRLLGVTAEDDDVVIEASEPVAYSVSKPDPLTLLIDMRNVTVIDAANHVRRTPAIANISLEQTTAVDGRAVARVRMSLARPAEHKVRSARNTIRVELSPIPANRADRGPGPADAPMMLAPSPSEIITVGLDEPAGAPVEPEPPLTLEQAIANAASLTPTDVPAPDPFTALELGAAKPASPVRPAPARQTAARPAARQATAPVPDVSVRQIERTPAAAPTRDVPQQVAPQPVELPRQTPGPQPVEVPRQAPAQPVEVPRQAPAPQPVEVRDEVPVAPQGPTTQAQTQAAPPARAQQPSTQPAPANTTQQQIAGAQEKKYSGHPITMDFQGVDLRSVLRTFAEISGLNMVIDPDVQGTVDMILTDVPWDQALEVILRGNSLDYTVDGSIVRVAKIDTLKKEQDARQQLAKASADAGTLAVRTFTLSYAKAAQAAPLVKRAVLSPRGDVQIDERTNTLIITDLPAKLDTVGQLLNTLDRAEPQVEVEARVVQTTREFAQAVGIQWGLNGRVSPELGNTPPLAFPNRGTLGGRTGTVNGPIGDPRAGGLETTSNAVNLGVPGASSAIGLALGSINGAFNLDIALSALERSGKGRILSTPRLTTQNNIEAEVAQGIQIPIQTVANNTVTVSFKEAVLVLKVTPQITTAGTVIMRILVENATADFSRQVNGIPPIDTQRANTTVQVNDGATTIIGGIFVSQEQIANERTPVLHRIPLLGWLFRRDSEQDQSRELLIFITPRILRG
jgi:type IV pilus assembly protein PilQ